MIPFEAAIERFKGHSAHSCGKCSLCCRLLDVPEVAKPISGWCKHARPGKGCAIYADRPAVCRGYACCWLLTKDMPQHWYPPVAKMVLDFSNPAHEAISDPDLRIHLHPQYPNRWREEPYYSELLWLARAGLYGKGGPWALSYQTVILKESERCFIVLPDKIIPWSIGVTLEVSPGRWEFIATKTVEKAVALHQTLDELNKRTLAQHRREIDAR